MRNELGGVQKNTLYWHPFASTTPSHRTPTGAAAKIYSSISNGDQLTTTENLHIGLSLSPAFAMPLPIDTTSLSKLTYTTTVANHNGDNNYLDYYYTHIYIYI